MNITSAKFIRGITGTQDILNDGKFQVAFMGRSNVGKSSLINSLSKRKALARSSATPGKTIRMDFFLVNNTFYFVDFPGYSYAQASTEKREKLRKMILWYLLYSDVKKRIVILVIDSKVGITEFDQQTIVMLTEKEIPYIIVANKIDNISLREKEGIIKKIQTDAGNSEVIQYSSKAKAGRDELMRRISEYINKSLTK